MKAVAAVNVSRAGDAVRTARVPTTAWPRLPALAKISIRGMSR